MTNELPKSFRDLSVKELRRSALEDFAVEVDPKASKDEAIAALVESGVSWADYVAQHPEVVPAPEQAEVVTTENLEADATNVAEPTKIRVAEELQVNPGEQFLIKMVRENPLYETRGYRFTKEHPYNLVSAEDAEYILSREDGFRQAFPSELQEFYG